jgi:polysaccharide export outer membrane protein
MGFLRIIGQSLVAGALVAVAGCGIMPASGPAPADVRAGQKDPESLPYALVRVNAHVEDVLAHNAFRITTEFNDRRGPTELRFGVGDVLSVTVFEASAGGLFIPSEASVRPGNFVTLPNQSVDTKGNIYVPYAGAIRAKGRTAVEVQQAIVEALKNRALEPQAVVAIVDQRASSFSVLGEVNRPERFAASASGERILDAITRAGGPRYPGFETWVMLEREGRRALAPFGALVYEPTNNIYVRPQDIIYVYREPQTYTVFGASGLQSGLQGGEHPFEAWRLSLAEALARANGLNDNLADTASVFLYRGETREVAEQLGINCANFPGPIIPVIYNLNLRDPAGYFLASKFEMRNKDVIYIANAASVEAGKVMQYVRLIAATVNDPLTAANSAFALKNAIQGTGNSAVFNVSPPVTTTATR